jgi:hypothetical protein
MSIDLAVWEGERPASDKSAASTYAELYSRYIEREYPTTPSDAIVRYVNTLLARWPDWAAGDDDSQDESPWAYSPLIEDASGPFFYFGMLWRRAAFKDAWSYAVETAEAQGLVCFDPQSARFAQA